MNSDPDGLLALLRERESLLFKNDVRCDADCLASLLDESFIEFGASGKRYRYSPGDVFGGTADVISIEDGSAELVDLADGAKLLLYVAVKVSPSGELSRSNRCSAWKRSGGIWKMVFHQGTAL